MSGAHLLLVSIGPVQDFIAQARRSRDLWFGSHLLSELSRAAARRIAEDGGKLIFPALPAGDAELRACHGPTRDGSNPPVSVANKILAELPEENEPELCAKAAREAVQSRWREIASRVRRERRAVLAADIDDVWDEQVEDILEFYAVWVRLGQDYGEARRVAEQALAGRKGLREFRPWRHDRRGAPKSGLDGARVSVLADSRNHREFSRLRIGEGEQLDAIGLIKRAGFDPEQFVPIVNIAAGDWLAQAEKVAPRELDNLRGGCHSRGIHRIERALPVVKPFPFDASVLYPWRWATTLKQADRPIDRPEEARKWGEDYVLPLSQKMREGQMGGEPPVYVACLVADGDRLGEHLGKLNTAEENRAFSRRLAFFPAEAREIVQQQYCGSLIYAGGDDVLAFLPVSKAPKCAAELAKRFSELFDGAVTLSVGIGIGHFMEQMSVLLDLARGAERAAKAAGRNALAIVFDKRSGGQRSLALNWDRKPIERLHQDSCLLQDGLSIGKIYELEALLRRFGSPTDDKLPAKIASAIGAYAEGVLAHSEEGREMSLSEIGVAPGSGLVRELQEAINRLLVVRSLREAGFR